MAFIDPGSNVSGAALNNPGSNAFGATLNGGSGWSSFLNSNPNFGSLLGPVAGLAMGLFGNSQGVPYSGPLTAVAGNISGAAAQAEGAAGPLMGAGVNLLNPLQTGQLPTGAQAEVQNYLTQANAATKSKYAQLGQTGSTMETDALNQNSTNAQALTFQIAQQMAQTGLQATGQSIQALQAAGTLDTDQANIYTNLMKAQMTQNSSLFSAIGSFAGAIGKAFL